MFCNGAFFNRPSFKPKILELCRCRQFQYFIHKEDVHRNLQENLACLDASNFREDDIHDISKMNPLYVT